MRQRQSTHPGVWVTESDDTKWCSSWLTQQENSNIGFHQSPIWAFLCSHKNYYVNNHHPHGDSFCHVQYVSVLEVSSKHMNGRLTCVGVHGPCIPCGHRIVNSPLPVLACSLAEDMCRLTRGETKTRQIHFGYNAYTTHRFRKDLPPHYSMA